jgi:hypothetical protein
MKDIPKAAGQLWYAAGVVGSKLLAAANFWVIFWDFFGAQLATLGKQVFGVRRGRPWIQ